jgi:hypothetical protein
MKEERRQKNIGRRDETEVKTGKTSEGDNAGQHEMKNVYLKDLS